MPELFDSPTSTVYVVRNQDDTPAPHTSSRIGAVQRALSGEIGSVLTGMGGVPDWHTGLAALPVFGGGLGALYEYRAAPTQVGPEHFRLVCPSYSARMDRMIPRSNPSHLALLVSSYATPSLLERSAVAGRSRFLPARTVVDRDPPAYRAFKDLARWIEADDNAIADMVGIGRTTAYAWRRAGHEPRPSTTRALYEHHNTLAAVRRRLGHAGLRAWLQEGAPRRRDQLLNGGLEQLERAVHGLLFRPEPGARPDLAAAREPTVSLDEATVSGRRRRASRRGTRRRQTG